MRKYFIALGAGLMLITQIAFAQFDSKTFSGLKFRNIGPAFVSGRIADIAIDQTNENIWYVAVASGGVWKTVNNGTTWTPIFDDQTSYATGCVTIDPNNPNTIWLGTGENVGGRHIAFGDGVYVSHDAGSTWKNMGLKNSEHVSKIIVHPSDPNTVWVASQGPLWSSGGDRGVYKSVDGGVTWKKTLGDSEWTGATDLLIDPRNPNVLYAATWDRHRTVAAYMGGGPGSGIHRSDDGGETWTKLTKGIPGGNLGKIGLAMSHFNPDVIYAAIETIRTKGGIYMSDDMGASWTKQSNTVSGGTGPHYYQELYASPHRDGTLYLMNNYVQISHDHGKTFYTMNEQNKHVDSHALAFKNSIADYLLFGTDGGLYETYDHTKTWRFIPNLPLTQYYKVAVDDTKPFYNVYGGTQDNGSHGGPSATTSRKGIVNGDWWKTLGADGHQSATEPGNPNITYGEFQQGALWRIDQTTGETVYIQPQPFEGTTPERFNWDAPILVSPHNPARLYFASQRVWRSENRGDAWTPISSDLTRNEERLTLEIMGKKQSWDNAWDVGAMSNYNTITSLSESPVQEGLLYAGTDDGIIQVSEDGGANWRMVDLSKMKNMPARLFINDIRADLYDANVVYAALDNHKYGDYRPFLMKSTNKGKTWTLMNGDLPERLLTWRLVQDHKDRNLMFAATEFGVYMTKNAGTNWIQLTGGLPTISFRDITIHRTADDLVGASFGRGFYILDDISPLRDMTAEDVSKEAKLFATKDALWYRQHNKLPGGQGDGEYIAENPMFGAVFTYYLNDSYKSREDRRKEAEKDKIKAGENVPFPGWDALDAEIQEIKPQVLLTVTSEDGEVINVVEGSNKKGFNRVNWEFDYADRAGVNVESGRSQGNSGIATPGTYMVTLSKVIDGVATVLAGPQKFNVVRAFEGALPGASYDEINAFRDEYIAFQTDAYVLRTELSEQEDLVKAMMTAYRNSPKQDPALLKELFDAREKLNAIDKAMNGSPAKDEVGERTALSPFSGMRPAGGALNSTYGPTENHKAAFNRSKEQLAEIEKDVNELKSNTLPALIKKLEAAGAPKLIGVDMN